MTLVLTDAAEAAMLSRILDPDMEIKLFKNDVTNGLTASQIEALDETDFTEATFDGYADVAIAGENNGACSDWTITSGDPGEAEAPQAEFACDMDMCAPETIYGYYVVLASGGALQWFEEFPLPQIIENNGDTIRVTLKFTLKDEVD